MIARCSKNNGVVLLAMLAVFVIVMTAALIASVSLNRQKINNQKNNLIVLTEAKEALLGYALRQLPPGLLPCPDWDGDGLADLNGSNCRTPLGFLPFKTLGLRESRDGAGALLWYAPEINYTNVALVSVLNSSSPSSLRLNATEVLAAVVLAPGAILGNQVRTNNSVVDYLEGINADGNPRNYSTTSGVANNDEVMPLRLGEFWTTIEKRVLGIARDLLFTYQNSANCGQLPWAANRASPYISVANLEIGSLPVDGATSFGGAVGCPANLSAPSWLRNHWADQLLYAFCGPSGAQCLAIAGDQSRAADAVLIAPGIALLGQSRPSLNRNQYFEGENDDTDLQFTARYPRNHDSNNNDLIQIVE